MASHGGMGVGSGRPAGAGNKATQGLKLNLSKLGGYTNDALGMLVEAIQSRQSDSARLVAPSFYIAIAHGDVAYRTTDCLHWPEVRAMAAYQPIQ